ncbi:hypothetical protein D3C87_1363140 [compost metagenome]
MQLELETTLLVGLGRVVLRNPHPTVPDNDIAGAIVTFGDAALEGGVVQRMVFDVHCQTLDLGVEGRAFWHCPALERTIELQAEVVMQARGVVFLNAELQRMILGVFPAGSLDGSRLGRRRKIAHAIVVIEVFVHGSPAYRCRALNQHVP